MSSRRYNALDKHKFIVYNCIKSRHDVSAINSRREHMPKSKIKILKSERINEMEVREQSNFLFLCSSFVVRM